MQGRITDASPRLPVVTGDLVEDCFVQLNPDSLHDLVGPVNQMRSMADLLLTRHRGKLDGEAALLLSFIQESSDRLQNLLSGLRTYTRIVGRIQPYRRFDAGHTLAGALATIQEPLAANDAVVTHDRLPELYGDPNQICYLFASLIENAVKFRSERRPEVHVSAMAQGGQWRFSVRDNGIGIDPRNRERIFGVFKRVHHDKFPGAGIGLAVASRIVERHAGRIWVESSLGDGATFFFLLPAVET